jgi:hypothetical protein
MWIYAVTHHHDHGHDTYLFRSKLDINGLPSGEELLASLTRGECDYEPDRNEWISIDGGYEFKNLPEIK